MASIALVPAAQTLMRCQASIFRQISVTSLSLLSGTVFCACCFFMFSASSCQDLSLLQEDRGVVTFIDERKKMRIPQRAKPKNIGDHKKKKITFKGISDSFTEGSVTMIFLNSLINWDSPIRCILL
jgi:hypothetical protein